MWLSLPVEQVFPLYPATQSQWKSFTSSVQFPPFWQGPSSQSSMSEVQKRGDVDRYMQRCYNEPRGVKKLIQGKDNFCKSYKNSYKAKKSRHKERTSNED